MGWRFPWVSSLGSDFNYDFGVAFTEEQRKNGADYNFRHVDEPEPQKEGPMSVFAPFRTALSTTPTQPTPVASRLEMGTYQFLDLAPLAARNEDGLDVPRTRRRWWRRHDEYDKR